MKKNMGTTDRVVRLLLAIALLLACLFKVISGTWAIAALILAAIFVLTSLVSFCPLYVPLGISTCRKDKIH